MQIDASTNSEVSNQSLAFNPFTPAIETPADQVEVAEVRLVQTVDEHGLPVTLKAQQLRFPDVYKLHVAQYGRQIEDDEEADLRLFTAKSIYQSTGNNSDIVDAMQKIKTKEQYDEFFRTRNSEVENIHHLLEMQEKKAIQEGKPLQNPLDNEKYKEHVRRIVEQMEKVGMLENAPNLQLSENTVAARAKKIRELQEQGYEVEIAHLSPELRKELGLADSETEYKNLVTESKKIDEALRVGMQTSNTANPADPQQAEALSQQIEGAAHIKKKVLDNQNSILRCDRTADGGRCERVYYLAAARFADDQSKFNAQSRRLDMILPVEPIVADEAISAVMRDCFVVDLMSNRLDTLVHPSKLYLYMTGVSHPKMVLVSDVRLFYVAMKKYYSQTNMRPKEKVLAEKMKQSKNELKAKLERLGLSAVVSTKDTPDTHMETHSKERITVIMNVGLEKAALEFSLTVEAILKQTTPNDEEATKNCLKQIYDAQRIFCVQTLNALELALLLYLEEYIPFSARADLMTSAAEGCGCCAPADSIKNVIERREWYMKFRRSTFLCKEAEIGRFFNIDHLRLPTNDSDRIDPLRNWTPTWKEMFEYVRYLALNVPKFQPGQTDEESEKAHRWVTKYINAMESAI